MSLQDQFRGYRHPFVFGVHYLGGIGDVPRTLTELAMCECSAELRRKPDWWKHHQNQDTRSEWSEEILQRVWRIRTPSSHADIRLSKKQVDYLLDELSGYAALRDTKNECQVSCFERVWETDSLPSTLELNHELSLLRATAPARHENGVSISLIDPFLHCFVYNKTLVHHPHSRHARTVPSPAGGDVYTVSPQFAFLPADVSVSPSGAATFLSYINNLHPQHTALYAQLEMALTTLLPLFEHTLTDLHRNNPLAQRIRDACRYTVWDEPEEPEFSDDEEGWAAYERDLRHWIMHRPIHLPDVSDTGYPGGLEARRHTVHLSGRTLQVIVNVTETRLQPGGPTYPGFPWHVEGMRNERIVACGMYYTSVENITPSALEFRMAVTYPRGFAAGDTGATLRTWGLRDGDACHQYIGARPIHAGLAIVFPNIYQHRQTAFILADPGKPGHQTVVAFWLVDPEVQPVVSTAVVPPQQKAWIRSAVDESLDQRVPVEVVEQIMDGVEGLMDAEEAVEYRRTMIETREKFREANDNYHFCIPFDIWSAPEFLH